MIILSKRVREWIRFNIKQSGKTREEIANEIGISKHSIINSMNPNVKIGSSTAIKILKYLNYPNLDKLKLEDKKIYKTDENGENRKNIKDCIEKYDLSMTEAARICGVSRQMLYGVFKGKTLITRNRTNEIINKITAEMEARNND